MRSQLSRQSARVRVVMLLLAVIAFGYLPAGFASAETNISGRVVEFKTDNGLKDIRVTIRVKDQGRPEAVTTTSSDGSYSLRLSSDPSRYDVTYDVPDRSDFHPAGRDNIVRVGPKITLDTVGLYNKREASNDMDSLAAHAHNTRGYVSAGGDEKAAREAITTGIMNFGMNFQSVGLKIGLKSAFESRDWQPPF